MFDIYENIEEYNPNKKSKILIVFNDMTADMLINKKLNPVITELFIRGRKLNIRLNYTHYFILKISNKGELQKIVFNHSSDIEFQDFMNLYKKCTSKPYFFLIIKATLASDNSSRFRKNLLEKI